MDNIRIWTDLINDCIITNESLRWTLSLNEIIISMYYEIKKYSNHWFVADWKWFLMKFRWIDIFFKWKTNLPWCVLFWISQLTCFYLERREIYFCLYILFEMREIIIFDDHQCTLRSYRINWGFLVNIQGNNQSIEICLLKYVLDLLIVEIDLILFLKIFQWNVIDGFDCCSTEFSK